MKDLTAQRRNNASISFGNSTRFWELVGIVAVSRPMQCEIAIKIVTEKIKIMNAEPRKRLEEAAEKRLNCNTCLARKYGECKENHKCQPYRSFLAGAEHGYKEAIALAKEWIFGYVRSTDFRHISAYDAERDFEADMNKILEEKK